ncbi:hypothetical protein GCM10009549_23850 [Streptomyces thermoalcalitolerans]|uniref:Uncharacterized protein n=1 Tax=Streptomyces thermoalcalitolerans TaxID=65605 RepID=A0ABN1NMW0_9ACTN
MPPYVVALGATAPCPTGLFEASGGGLAVGAEGTRDDGGGRFEEVLPEGGVVDGGTPASFRSADTWSGWSAAAP